MSRGHLRRCAACDRAGPGESVAYHSPLITSRHRLLRAVLTAGVAGAAVAVCLVPPAASAAPTPYTTERQLAAADTYLTALGDRTKASDVPFARDAVRFENGLQTGFSGDQMRRDLDLHIQYSVMTAPVVTSRAADPRDPDVLRYRFIVPVVIGGAHIVDAPTDETFRIPRSVCRISRIDAQISITPPASGPRTTVG